LWRVGTQTIATTLVTIVPLAAGALLRSSRSWSRSSPFSELRRYSGGPFWFQFKRHVYILGTGPGEWPQRNTLTCTLEPLHRPVHQFLRRRLPLAAVRALSGASIWLVASPLRSDSAFDRVHDAPAALTETQVAHDLCNQFVLRSQERVRLNPAHDGAELLLAVVRYWAIPVDGGARTPRGGAVAAREALGLVADNAADTDGCVGLASSACSSLSWSGVSASVTAARYAASAFCVSRSLLVNQSCDQMRWNFQPRRCRCSWRSRSRSRAV
jgi:hypothetical protein